MLPKPNKNAIIYKDKKVYACLANEPIVEGHTVVVWKKNVRDLCLLSKQDYGYLMDKLNLIRNALLKTLKIEKVYLLYIDETKHVHWHLIPRYNKKGLKNLTQKPKILKDFSLVNKIKHFLI